MEFTHFDESGNAIMVNVSGKEDTVREAIAKGRIKVNDEIFEAIKNGNTKKGNVLGIARVAGIMATKRTSDLIPLCHVLNLTKATIDFELYNDTNEVEVICTVGVTGKTGVEMEALTGASVALLTIYDMCKAIDKNMEIGDIHLHKKSGGKSGNFINNRLEK